MKKLQLRQAIKFLPNLLKLLYRLLKDPRVAAVDKAILAGAIVYVITPLDIIPDFIPIIGQVDDIYVVAIALLRLINNSQGNVVAEHWDGGGNIQLLAQRLAQVGQFWLPPKVRHYLTGRVKPETIETKPETKEAAPEKSE